MCDFEETPVIIIPDDDEPPRKRFRSDKFILEDSSDDEVVDLSSTSIKHIDRYSKSIGYHNTTIVKKPIYNNPEDDVCNLCVKIYSSNNLTKISTSFFGGEDNQCRINNIDNMLVCKTCINYCFIKSIKLVQKLIIPKPKVIYSLSGTRIPKDRDFDRPSVVIVHLDRDVSRYIVLELGTMESFLKDHTRLNITIKTKKFIKNMKCLHCKKHKPEQYRNYMLHTKNYLCNDCKKNHVREEYIKIDDKYVKLHIDHDMHKSMTCDKHVHNKQYVYCKVSPIKINGVIPMCFVCFEELYKSSQRIL